jgi:DNA polymerase I-like protein with 3'-5' exonuclease and polymerase domains
VGCLEIPSGRYYKYEPKLQRGDWKWPLTTIKNYPVQGFGADLVKLARIEALKRLKEYPGALFIATVHDSLVCDVDNDDLVIRAVGKLLNDSVEAVPRLCREHFNYEFSLPLTAEIQFGPNKFDMQDLYIV